MYEFIEGMMGVEVVVDDFIVVGYGEMFEKVIWDYDRNFFEFFKWCEIKNVCLNLEKLKLW